MANQAVRVPEPSVESSASGVHWGAITAGALGAVGITFVLTSLGPALGHVIVSPWSPSGSAPTAFGIAAGIWLIVTQWLASGLGGYLAGRLREKWVGISNRRGAVPRHRAWISCLVWSFNQWPKMGARLFWGRKMGTLIFVCPPFPARE